MEFLGYVCCSSNFCEYKVVVDIGVLVYLMWNWLKFVKLFMLIGFFFGRFISGICLDEIKYSVVRKYFFVFCIVYYNKMIK